MKVKKLINLLIVVLIFLHLGSIAAFAEATPGSIIIRVETAEDDLPVPGYKLHFSFVADPEGYLNADFEDAGILPADMLNKSANADNASTLCAHAKANGISGSTVVTDMSGEVRFSNLAEGIYLIWPSVENELIFLPYLIYMPTDIGGEEFWEVLSIPKVAPKPTPPAPEPPGTDPDPIIPVPPYVDPVIPPIPGGDPVPSPVPGVDPEPGQTPETPSDPQIPQTGIDRTPALILFIFGLMFTACGVVIIVQSKGSEEDD